MPSAPDPSPGEAALQQQSPQHTPAEGAPFVPTAHRGATRTKPASPHPKRMALTHKSHLPQLPEGSSSDSIPKGFKSPLKALVTDQAANACSPKPGRTELFLLNPGTMVPNVQRGRLQNIPVSPSRPRTEETLSSPTGFLIQSNPSLTTETDFKNALKYFTLCGHIQEGDKSHRMEKTLSLN